jgi:hypothetical protein
VVHEVAPKRAVPADDVILAILDSFNDQMEQKTGGAG